MIRLSKPSIGDEECKVVERVLRSGHLVHGEECDFFEQELAHYLGCKDVVVVSSGTAALHLALLALGIGEGDAVIVPDFTFPATVNVVELVGARPILVDVDSNTYNITPENIQRAINGWNGKEKIRAIMPVHEFGCPADMTAIMKVAEEYNLLVIEDAACGLGAVHDGQKVGTFGQAGCFSFHPRKSITTGEGGAIATSDVKLADKLRIWRNHGIKHSNSAVDFVLAGLNYRMTNFQAALGRVQLTKFDDWLKMRHQLQKVYHAELVEIDVLLPVNVVGHAWQTYMIVLPDKVNREEMTLKLKEKGIETNLGAYSIHCQPYYKQKYPEMCKEQQSNNAERLFRCGLALPLCQEYFQDDIALICNEFKEALT